MAQVRITRQDYDQETFDDIDDNDSNTSQEHIVQNLDIPDGTDHVFNRIQTTIENNLKKRNSTLSLLSSTTSDEETVQISDHYTSVPFDIQPRATYDHGRKNTDIIGVAYNGRMRQFVLLDAKGITTWKRDAVEHRVTRAYLFNKYEYRMFTHIIYVRKFNCYFVLTKELSLKVLNRDFEETCSVSADLRSILFMLFNPLKDELITGGVGGTKFWTFHQVAENIFKDLKPMANYRLTLKYELPDVGGSWVKRVELDHHLEHLYCCSDTDLNVYNLHGKILFKFKKAHKMTITGCRYSMSAKVLVTSSVDCDVKVWSMTGGLVHTFRGHSRAVSNLILHPDNSSIIITSSLDGTIRMWSLETMEQLYSLVASSDGIMWMSLTDDNMLYICTCKHLTLWSLNYFYEFWSMARSKVTSMSLVGCPKKTTRIVTIAEDNSVRFFARKSQKNLSTVLPPPDLSPLEQISSMCYSREFNVAFLLIARNEQKTNEIWVYTTRTDPSCRMAVWDVREIQIPYLMRRHKSDTEGVAVASVFNNKEGPVYRATENGTGTESLTVCCCVCILNSTVLMMTEEGEASPIRQTYLLLGMEDGRVFFMDPVVKGLKYMEFKASKDAIVAMSHDSTHNSLVTISNLKYLTQIQIWTLPTLFLEHEVYCALDILRYTRINESFLTGHENGCVNLYILEPIVDQGYIKTRSRTVIPELEDVVDVYKRPEHLESIMCLDSCQAMKIFCSSSVDGAIKIWDEQRLLLTEIMMDGSLSSVCFLNNKADLIMGFKNHIFYIDHTKVCPHLKPSGDEDDEFDKESVIYEDPAVSYEGIVANPDPIDLEHYLIPYEIEFSKDFLEGKPLWDSSSEEENEDSDLESLYSMAPTEIYFSPPGTPGELQDIDLIMRSEVTRNDLKKQMRSTMEHLLHRAYQINDVDMKGKDVKLEQQQHFLKLIRFRLALERNVKLKKKKKREDGTMSSDVDTDGDEELSRWRFNFPKFGQSPGPSPTLSILSTALSGASDDDSDVSYEEVIGTDGKKRMKKKPKKKGFKPIEKIDIATSAVDVKKPKARYKGHYAEGESSGIGDVRLDVKTLLKKAAEAQKKEADHSHIRGEIDEHVSSVVRKHRDIQKKKVYKRRRPKQGQKLPNKPIPQTPVQIQDIREPSPEPEEEATEIKTQVTTEQDIIDDDVDDTYPDTKPPLIYPHVDPISIPDLPQVPELPEKEPLARKISNPNKKTMIEFFDLQKPGIGVSPTTEIDQQDENNDISKKKVSVTSDGTRSIYSEYSEGDDLIPPVMMASPDPLSVGDEQEFRQGNLIQINVTGSPDSGWVESEYTSASAAIHERGDEDDQDGLKVDTDDKEEGMGKKRRPLSSFVETRIYNARFKNKTRPVSASEIRQHREKELDLISRLPRTRRDLHVAFNEAYHRYQRLSSKPVTPYNLHKNDDKSFDDNWHERVIERHMLLRMQKELRAHHAAMKRKQMEEEQRNKNKHILGLYDYDEDCLETMECQEHAPPSRKYLPHPPRLRHKTASSIRETPNPPQSTPANSRPDTALPVNQTQAIPPYSSKHEHSHFKTDRQRPKTAKLYREKGGDTSSRSRYETVSHYASQIINEGQNQQRSTPRNRLPQHNSEMKSRSYSSFQHVVSESGDKKRPHTVVHGQDKQPSSQRAAIRLDERTEKILQALSRYNNSPDSGVGDDNLPDDHTTTPYRFNFGKPSQVHKNMSSRSCVGFDTKQIDPRNPQAVRPKSSKSIPSKCSRYILLSKPKEKLLYPLPTPLEEHLLAERFPMLGNKVYEHYDGLIVRHRKPTYNIDYTPFARELYG